MFASDDFDLSAAGPRAHGSDMRIFIGAPAADGEIEPPTPVLDLS
jgi:hypothetical protein